MSDSLSPNPAGLTANLEGLLSASVFIERARRWCGPIEGETVNIYRVYGESADEAVEVFAKNEVLAARCARATTALRSYAGELVVRYVKTIRVPTRKAQVA